MQKVGKIYLLREMSPIFASSCSQTESCLQLDGRIQRHGMAENRCFPLETGHDREKNTPSDITW